MSSFCFCMFCFNKVLFCWMAPERIAAHWEICLATNALDACDCSELFLGWVSSVCVVFSNACGAMHTREKAHFKSMFSYVYCYYYFQLQKSYKNQCYFEQVHRSKQKQCLYTQRRKYHENIKCINWAWCDFWWFIFTGVKCTLLIICNGAAML